MIDITIITINYNNAKGLQETFHSVMEQGYKNFEYVIIDGGSSDESKEFIDNNSNNIDFWVSEKDDGIYNAMNKGLLKSSGKYVLFLNSGDTFFSKDALGSFAKYFNNEYDIVYGNLSVLGDEKEWIKIYPSQLSFAYLVNDTLPFPCTIIKKAVLLELGMFDESLKIVSDWKFFIFALCKSNKKYSHIDETIANFRLDGISSTNVELVKKERNTVLENEFSLFLKDYYEAEAVKIKLQVLRSSKKIKWLQKLRLLNEF